MRLLGGEVVSSTEVGKKAMWLYPKVLGFNPSERWGHSACSSNGVVYIFGGCCGGLHFSDVLTLNLETMAWNSLETTGKRPGTRDSHSAVLVGHQMIVFGGTNGSKKVNDLHILDLKTKEWSIPNCEGIPPSPRESHTATVVGDDTLVIFGGSGEGESNYLNDSHVLDLKTMKWISLKVKGGLPSPRDSHIAVAIHNKLLVYGGDCGDRYHGEVDVLDMDTVTWSKLSVQGNSPGVRAGHAAVNIGTKVYIIGGVGDKHYYNDVWILDVNTCSWTQLDTRGHKPQGRFSHTAVLTNSDIAIYGGCGEDERPLNDLLILQLGSEHPNGRYNISLCKIFGNHWNLEKRRFLQGTEPDSVYVNNREQHKRASETEPKPAVLRNSDTIHAKKRKTSDSKPCEVESEQEEHSLSLSQHSSPSQSDQEHTPSKPTPRPLCLLKQRFQNPNVNNVIDTQPYQISSIRRSTQDFHFVGGENPRHPPKQEQFLHMNAGRPEGQFSIECKPMEAMPVHSLIGADVRGKVDGAFDSGFLMTANVNGKILRGILFAPGNGFIPRGAVLPPSSQALGSSVPVFQPYSSPLSLLSKKRKMKMLAIIFSVLLCASTAVAVVFIDGLLPNGNFEYGPKPSQMKGTRVIGQDAIPNWHISGFVEYIGSGQKQGDMLLVVPEGAFAVRLGNEASIKQKVKVTKGMYYSITFSAARTCAQEERLNVSVAPDFGILPMQTLYSSNGWDSHAWAFQAEYDEAEILIHNPGVEEDAACGPLIDSIALKTLYPPRATNKNLLRNGDFEEGPYVFPNTSWGVLIPPNIEDDHSPLPGWMIESLKAVKYIDSDHFSVPQGTRGVELVAGKESAIAQVVRTIPGKHYVLTLSVGDARNACEGSMVVEAFAGNVTLKVPYQSTGKGGFKRAALRFVATSTRTRIMFYSTFYTMRSDDFSSLCGPVIDDARLVSIRKPKHM